jgi:hypothetical protein
MSAPLFTATVRCKDCGTILNTAQHVPEHCKTQILISAPLMCLCEEPSHNRPYQDCNLNWDILWSPEYTLLPEKCDTH